MATYSPSMSYIFHGLSHLRIKAGLSALLLSACYLLTGCSTAGTLNVPGVTYQSVNTRIPQPSKGFSIPADAKIMASYAIDEYGKLAIFVKNLTSEIMIIDQEMSFLVNTDGVSTSYFDPTIRTSTTTNFDAATNGMSVNLGSIASAFGVGGPLGSLLGGMNVSNSATQGVSNANSVMIADQKRIMLGPKGSCGMSKFYTVKGIGKNALIAQSQKDLTYETSPLRFSVCISYSVNDGATFEKFVTDFYVESNIYERVLSKGKVNQALRRVYAEKPNCLDMPWFILYMNNNIKGTAGDDFFIPANDFKKSTYDNIVQGMLVDFQ